MFGWLEELLEIRYQWKKRKLELVEKNYEITPVEDNGVLCESCETLRQQLSIANQEKKILLEKLLEPKTQTEAELAVPNILRPIQPRGVRNWNDQKRMLEENDRAKARAMRENAAENKISTEDLEKELDIVRHPVEGTEGVKHVG